MPDKVSEAMKVARLGLDTPWDELVAWAAEDRKANGLPPGDGRLLSLAAINERRRCGECGGFRSKCKKCKRQTAKQKYATSLEVRLGNRDRHLRRTYGITLLEYDAMVARQGGKCAACSEKLVAGKATHVDHCHDTQKVRAILCHKCNVTLGNAGDDSRRLRLLANYIDRYNDLCPTSGIIGHA